MMCPASRVTTPRKKRRWSPISTALAFESDDLTKTLIDIDDALLAEAAEALGTTTKKDTVNAALELVATRTQRAQALARLGEKADRGDFDILLDKRNYRR